MVFSGLFLEDFEFINLILIHVIYWNFKKYEFFKISSNPFHVAKTNQNEKKIALPSTVCHGLPANAFQVNQLYNVTWSNEGAFFIPIAPAFSQNVFSFSILLYSRIFCSDNLIRNAA